MTAQQFGRHVTGLERSRETQSFRHPEIARQILAACGVTLVPHAADDRQFEIDPSLRGRAQHSHQRLEPAFGPDHAERDQTVRSFAGRAPYVGGRWFDVGSDRHDVQARGQPRDRPSQFAPAFLACRERDVRGGDDEGVARAEQRTFYAARPMQRTRSVEALVEKHADRNAAQPHDGRDRVRRERARTEVERRVLDQQQLDAPRAHLAQRPQDSANVPRGHERRFQLGETRRHLAEDDDAITVTRERPCDGSGMVAHAVARRRQSRCQERDRHTRAGLRPPWFKISRPSRTGARERGAALRERTAEGPRAFR